MTVFPSGKRPNTGRVALAAILSLALAACGGGASQPTAGTGGGGTPTNNACSIANQISFASDVLNEWYLFPDLLDNTVNAANFTTVQSYLDARVAPARAQSVDRGFTFATSIQEENDLINSGASAGFGIRLTYDTVNDRVFVLEAFEVAPAFAAGMDRGTELLAIGVDANSLQLVSNLMATGGPQAVIDALGPGDPGVSRVIRFRTVDGTVIEIAVTKEEFAIDPISDRYGALIINDNGRNVGYINLRTFIVADAANQLRDAFQLFNANGVTELILDFRYNGGGLVSVANTFGDLMGEGRTGQVWSNTVLRPSKSSENETRFFTNEVQSLQPTKIAFVTTGNSASASELVINSMLPYLGNADVALVGANSFGKPVGQFGFDLDACDLRVRALSFQTTNANDEGEYFTGLASVVPNTCAAGDDIFTPLGDPGEASVAQALSFLNNGAASCTAISAKADDTLAQRASERLLLQPETPSAAQREVPGLF